MSRTTGDRDRLLRAVHARAREIGLDDDGRRELQEIATGKTSCSSMTSHELRRVLEAMDAAAGRDRIAGGPHYRKIWALWLSAWNLGVTASRSEAALAAFVKRQTGLDAAAWAHDPALSGKVVEGLKAWLARPVNKGGAGVDWSACAGPDGRPTDNPRIRVLEAQRRILRRMAPDEVVDGLADEIADELIRQFGERIRALDAQARPPDG